jgi:hypothetical protein
MPFWGVLGLGSILRKTLSCFKKKHELFWSILHSLAEALNILFIVMVVCYGGLKVR